MSSPDPTPGRPVVALLAMAVLATACGSAAADLMNARSGGEATTQVSGVGAFSQPAPNLSADELKRFERGNDLFTVNWVETGLEPIDTDGLGPLHNASSCSGCHLRDGRGDPSGDEPGLLFRLGVLEDSGMQPEPTYGDQLQDRSLPGVPAEGTVRRMYVEEPGTYDDGTPYTLRRPVYEFEDLAYGSLSVDVLVSPRLATPVFGAGLLEAIPEDSITAGADPEDTDGDGISGRANYVVDMTTGELILGRFGWKAGVPTVEQQIARAFREDIGITNPLLGDEACTGPQVTCAALAGSGSPEIEPGAFDDVVLYSSTLAAPARRNLDSPAVEQGARLFLDLECHLCHEPRQTTGSHPIGALSNQVIYPFTDLLLHDMGAGLADGQPDGLATGSEWRTPPLWGLGLNQAVNGHTFFLHDGRARTLEEAILWHGGEAEQSAQEFRRLDADQRAALIEFLGSL